MPRINLEYSANIPDQDIAFQDLFKELHENLAADGFCNIAAVKSRAVEQANFCVAGGEEDQAFVMLTVGVLGGRDLDVLQAKGELLLTILKRYFPIAAAQDGNPITVEIREMNRDLYFL